MVQKEDTLPMQQAKTWGMTFTDDHQVRFSFVSFLPNSLFFCGSFPWNFPYQPLIFGHSLRGPESGRVFPVNVWGTQWSKTPTSSCYVLGQQVERFLYYLYIYTRRSFFGGSMLRSSHVSLEYAGSLKVALLWSLCPLISYFYRRC